MPSIHKNISSDASHGTQKLREKIDLLKARANLLTGKDKIIMNMYLKNGNSFRQLAQLLGINEANVARRIRRITNRLIEGKYIKCMRNRDKFTSEEIRIAKNYFVDGLPMSRIAARQQSSYYHIRETVKKIESCIQVLEQD
jgi:predicted DNA-binding protein YlxM (UPF0122 family)